MPNSTVYATCAATRVSTKSKVDRTHVQRGKRVKYALQVLNKVEKGLCIEDLCVRVDLPAGVAYSKSGLFPPKLLQNTTGPSRPGSRRQRKPAGTGRLITVDNCTTTSILWSGISLGPGKGGRFSVKMVALSGPDGHPSTLTIHGSVYQCAEPNACKGNVPPTSVRTVSTNRIGRSAS